MAAAKRQADIEKRRRQRATALAIAAGLMFLVASVVGVWAWGQKKEAQAATISAESAKNKAIESDSLTKLALSIADSSKVKALEAEEVAKNQKTKAVLAALKASNSEKATKAALDKLQITSNEAVTILLAEIDRNVLRLEYDSTFQKCQTAVNLKAQRLEVNKRVLEIAYFYTETDSFDVAIKTLKLLTISAGVHSDNAELNRANLLAAIQKNAPPQYFPVLEARYYPKMIAVEGDSFTMGYDPDTSYQNTPHPVTVSSFKIAQTETTVWQYFLYLKAKHQNPRGTPSWQYWGDNPMIYVSWYDAVNYCNWVSERHGLQKVYNLTNQNGSKDFPDYDVTIDYTQKGYRLPTEAEWEFAARGGKFHEGFEYSGESILNNVAWYNENSNNRTQPVSTKKPNKLRLFDMSGNVWEWCNDWYAPYDTLKTNNPHGAEKGGTRLLRGGSWDFSNYYSRLADRSSGYPRYYVNYYGFRVLQDK